MRQIFFKDIKDREGRLAYYPESNIYIFAGRGMEVVKPIIRKQPDGTLCGKFPSDEQFGPYGKCLSWNWFKNRMARWLIDNPDKWDCESVVEIKKTFKYDEPDLPDSAVYNDIDPHDYDLYGKPLERS